ncbi:MAG: FAD-dependent oxidoreductase [Thiovulaceae bacterium]|nr:FAD-dependent oxidoreductase [Sulfurimonadaceae bacterium]
MNKKKLIIVGAGLSGLYLASRLEKEFDVTLLEARERVGGRIYSQDGHDLGPSWIWPHHTDMQALVKSLGLKLFRQYDKGYALFDTQNRVEHFTSPPSSPLARVEGSLSKLIEKLYTTLTNTQMILNQELLHVEYQKRNIVVTTQNKSYESDYLILTLPPRICVKLTYNPPLPQALKEKMQTTQTWMGNSAKCVVEFGSAIWRERGLNGFVFSNQGPLSEIHDACTDSKAALFGFMSLHQKDISHVNADDLKLKVTEQMVRVFGIDPREIQAIYFVDWKEERFTSVAEDKKSLSSHPDYGIDAHHFDGQLLFSSTEFSHKEGGYLEGALINAKKTAQTLLDYKNL